MPERNGKCLRHELKYHLDRIQYEILRKKLAIILKPDPYVRSDGRYHVRSLYFDDFRNTALIEKQDGILKRKKYRIRIYNLSEKSIKLERKIKLGQYVLKESERIDREEVDRIILGDVSFLANSKSRLLKDFYLECRYNLLRPVVIVDFHREAYIYPVSDVRITLDVDLRIGLGSMSLFDSDAPTIKVNDIHSAILEIKFDKVLPSHIRGLFPRTIRLRSAIGKFAICRTQQISKEVDFYVSTRKFGDISTRLASEQHKMIDLKPEISTY